MIYDLELPRREFDAMSGVVRSVMYTSRMEPRGLRTITNDSSLLTDENQGYLEDNPGVLGVCFGQGDNKYFDVWLNPAYRNTDTDFFKDTVLHELCHGFFGLYTHEYKWKRLFGRVLHHQSALGTPVDTDTLVSDMLKRYSRRKPLESVEKFAERLENEQHSIASAARNERPFVSSMYDRMENTRDTRTARVA